jgi:hypothetical protein
MGVVDKVENLLNCAICMIRYDLDSRLPLSLNCGHTLCKVCARSLIGVGRIKCPFDNRSQDCRLVETLGRNFTILDILEAERAKEGERE